MILKKYLTAHGNLWLSLPESPIKFLNGANTVYFVSDNVKARLYMVWREVPSFAPLA